jgi:hypothetical protein
MKSIADQLPPEIARQIHPDRRKNEADYWAARDQLLDQYRGQWIGFADGKVIASGSSPVTVFTRPRHRAGILFSSALAGKMNRAASVALPRRTTPVIPVKPCRCSASSSGRRAAHQALPSIESCPIRAPM